MEFLRLFYLFLQILFTFFIADSLTFLEIIYKILYVIDYVILPFNIDKKYLKRGIIWLGREQKENQQGQKVTKAAFSNPNGKRAGMEGQFA